MREHGIHSETAEVMFAKSRKVCDITTVLPVAEGAGSNSSLPLNFVRKLPENLLVAKKFRPKMQNLGPKTENILGKLRSKNF